MTFGKIKETVDKIFEMVGRLRSRKVDRETTLNNGTVNSILEDNGSGNIEIKSMLGTSGMGLEVSSSIYGKKYTSSGTIITDILSSITNFIGVALTKLENNKLRFEDTSGTSHDIKPVDFDDDTIAKNSANNYAIKKMAHSINFVQQGLVFDGSQDINIDTSNSNPAVAERGRVRWVPNKKHIIPGEVLLDSIVIDLSQTPDLLEGLKTGYYASLSSSDYLSKKNSQRQFVREFGVIGTYPTTPAGWNNVQQVISPCYRNVSLWGGNTTQEGEWKDSHTQRLLGQFGNFNSYTASGDTGNGSGGNNPFSTAVWSGGFNSSSGSTDGTRRWYFDNKNNVRANDKNSLNDFDKPPTISGYWLMYIGDSFVSNTEFILAEDCQYNTLTHGKNYQVVSKVPLKIYNGSTAAVNANINGISTSIAAGSSVPLNEFDMFSVIDGDGPAVNIQINVSSSNINFTNAQKETAGLFTPYTNSYKYDISNSSVDNWPVRNVTFKAPENLAQYTILIDDSLSQNWSTCHISTLENYNVVDQVETLYRTYTDYNVISLVKQADLADPSNLHITSPAKQFIPLSDFTDVSLKVNYCDMSYDCNIFESYVPYKYKDIQSGQTKILLNKNTISIPGKYCANNDSKTNWTTMTVAARQSPISVNYNYVIFKDMSTTESDDGTGRICKHSPRDYEKLLMSNTTSTNIASLSNVETTTGATLTAGTLYGCHWSASPFVLTRTDINKSYWIYNDDTVDHSWYVHDDPANVFLVHPSDVYQIPFAKTIVTDWSAKVYLQVEVPINNFVEDITDRTVFSVARQYKNNDVDKCIAQWENLLPTGVKRTYTADGKPTGSTGYDATTLKCNTVPYGYYTSISDPSVIDWNRYYPGVESEFQVDNTLKFEATNSGYTNIVPWQTSSTGRIETNICYPGHYRRNYNLYPSVCTTVIHCGSTSDALTMFYYTSGSSAITTWTQHPSPSAGQNYLIGPYLCNFTIPSVSNWYSDYSNSRDQNICFVTRRFGGSGDPGTIPSTLPAVGSSMTSQLLINWSNNILVWKRNSTAADTTNIGIYSLEPHYAGNTVASLVPETLTTGNNYYKDGDVFIQPGWSIICKQFPTGDTANSLIERQAAMTVENLSTLSTGSSTDNSKIWFNDTTSVYQLSSGVASLISIFSQGNSANSATSGSYYQVTTSDVVEIQPGQFFYYKETMNVDGIV